MHRSFPSPFKGGCVVTRNRTPCALWMNPLQLPYSLSISFSVILMRPHVFHTAASPKPIPFTPQWCPRLSHSLQEVVQVDGVIFPVDIEKGLTDLVTRKEDSWAADLRRRSSTHTLKRSGIFKMIPYKVRFLSATSILSFVPLVVFRKS